MGNGDLAADLGIVAPASSVRPEARNVHDEGAKGKSRRRSQDETNPDGDDTSLQPDDQPAHQLDHLA
jgi:hypothetical protein